MAKNLQEALLEVQEDLKRIGLAVKSSNNRKRSRRNRRSKRPASQPSVARQTATKDGPRS